MIKLQVIGHLGKDCVQSEVSGKNVINFNVAHSERYKDATGNLKERTIWVSCAYWTDRTGIVPYLVKGQLVYVEGTPDVEVYTNKDNQPTAALRLRVFNVQLLGGKADSQGAMDSESPAGTTSAAYGSATSQNYGSSQASSAADDVDDLPF